MTNRHILITCLAATLVLLASMASGATPSSAQTIAIAGRVKADPAVLPYVFLHVISDRNGAVLRSTSADATSAFTFAGLPSTATEVKAHVQLPADLYALDESASVLSAKIDRTSPLLELRVVATPVKSASAAAAKFGTTAAMPAEGASMTGVLPGVVTLAVLVAAWYLRNLLVCSLDLPTIKPIKPRKVMMMR